MLTMYAPPLDLPPGDPSLIEWFRTNGIPPETVASGGMHWAELSDGTFKLHYLEFVLNEAGARIVGPSAQDGYGYGKSADYVKRPRIAHVHSRPACTVEVAR